MQKQKQPVEADVIRRVTVRLVREEERGEFDFRLEDRHYLQSARLAGQTLRYVPPSDSTFFRVISRLDAAQFELVVGSWLLAQDVSVLARLAVDGKSSLCSANGRCWACRPNRPAWRSAITPPA
jgi:hypothetical protein